MTASALPASHLDLPALLLNVVAPAPIAPALSGARQTGFNHLLDQAVEQAVDDDATESPAGKSNFAASQLPANLLQPAVPPPNPQIPGTPEQPLGVKTPGRPLPLASRQTSTARATHKASKLPEPAGVVGSLAPSTPVPPPSVTDRLDSQPAPTLPDPTLLELSAPDNPSHAIAAPSGSEEPSPSGLPAQAAETLAATSQSAKHMPEVLPAYSKPFSQDHGAKDPVAAPPLPQDAAPTPVLAPSVPVEAAPAPPANSPVRVDAPPAISAPAPPQTSRTAPRARPDARPSMASLRSTPKEPPSEPASPEAPIPPATPDPAPAPQSEFPAAVTQSADASAPTVTRIDGRRAPPAGAEPAAQQSRPQTDRPPETHAESAVTPERAFADRLARVLASAKLPPVEPAPPSTDVASPTTTAGLAFSTRLVPSQTAQTPSATAPRPPVEAPPPTPARPTGTQPDTRRDVDSTSNVTAKPAVHRAPATDEAASSAAAPPSATLDVAARAVPAADPSAARRTDDATPAAAPARPTAIVDVPAEPPKVAPAVHDIRLQINGGDQRVDVRIVERGGDVHVAVRTPDANLAGTLREDLPSLSARLEQTGFHAETWHTGSPAQERQPLIETAAGAAPQNQDNRSGHDRGQQQDGRQPPRQQQDQPRKEDRKDFAWLFTSLR